MISMHSQLLSLPNELQLQVAEHIQDQPSLCSLAQTCSQLQEIAESYLYRHILIHTAEHAIQVSEAIKSRPQRAGTIIVLGLRYWRSESTEGTEELISKMPLMKNLQEWAIESPFCNSITHKESYEWPSALARYLTMTFGEFPSPSLEKSPRELCGVMRNLQSCSPDLMPDGQRFWDLADISVIFTHPTLRNITVSCAVIGDNLDTHYWAAPGSTALSSLVLEECSISDQGLYNLLSLPKALQRLTINEVLYHPEQEYKMCLNPSEKFYSALHLHRSSLQYLQHTAKGESFSTLFNLPNDGLSAFDALEEVQVTAFPLEARTVPQLYTHHPTPSNLSKLTLHLTNRAWVVSMRGNRQRLANTLVRSLQGIQENILTNKFLGSFFKSLRQVDIVMLIPGTLDFWESPDLRSFGIQLGERLATLGIQLRLFSYYKSMFIPPYLFGEDPGKVVLAYDSTVKLEDQDLKNSQRNK